MELASFFTALSITLASLHWYLHRSSSLLL